VKQRSKVGGEPVKARRHKAATLKRRIAPKPISDRRISAAGLQQLLDHRTRELNEAEQQQTATSGVLRVISQSPFDLPSVLDTLVQLAARLCEAEMANIWRPKGGVYRMAASNRYKEYLEKKEYLDTVAIERDRRTVTGRALLDGKTVHVHDIQASDYDPSTVVALGGYRTVLSVPLQSQGVPIGAITLTRSTVHPFTEKQIELIETFADQAVIAIENARLFEAEQQRTSELTQSLEQQTATADVLKVISRSTFDLQTVLDTLTTSAARLCAADQCGVFQRDGDSYRLVANLGFSHEAVRYAVEHPLRPDQGSVTGRAALEGRTIHIPDVLADREYHATGYQQALGFRVLLGVPLRREGTTIGVFTLARKRASPFTEKQIALVTTFADQAVIAIENVRLFEAEHQRTRELSESLEQQTATSEVLQVISSSPGDLQPIFATMLENAVRICGAKYGNIYRWDGELLHLLAAHNTPPALAEARRQSAVRPAGIIRRMVETKTAVHLADLAAHENYIEEHDPGAVAAVELGGTRTMLTVPMVKENELVGSFSLYRREVRPFTDKQIALVASFANQAVIAIENTRLLSELRQRTDELGRSVDELRALGEISQAVNSTLDLETVLSTIVAKAVQLSNTDAGAIYVFDEAQREFHLRATYSMDQELIDALRKQHLGLEETNIASVLAQRDPVQVPDLREEGANEINRITLRAGYRARLTAPLFRGDDIVGLLVVRRRTPGAFPRHTVGLVKTFAAQSVLAIQNARLFENVETRTRESAASLADLRTAQERLIQTEKLASLGQLTAGIAHEIKNPLNFVNNFSSVSAELIDEMQQIMQDVQIDEEKRAEVAELTNMLRGNLEKVVQHGKRADSIVKNMLLHSRQGSGEHQPADINAIVEESLNLAYHGARAEKQGFNITLERSFDPSAGKVDLFPQEITRVLLNLISNGFYAATKRKAETNGGDYEPTLSAATKNLGDSVEIRIRDNGTGILPEVREKMFNPFFTTKPAGEGTGLGLSLTHDIIVKQHSGSIEVDTRPGEFTEFRIVLPRGSAGIAKSGGSA
jgi:two-component system, NtrC family, sensor kinase